MSMSVRVGMVMSMSMMFPGTMRVLVGMIMLVAMAVVVVMTVTVLMVVVMSMLMVFGTNAHRLFSGQSASAFFTHQSISSEATSISRPARSSPLKL
jgi:hypothetical protein